MEKEAEAEFDNVQQLLDTCPSPPNTPEPGGNRSRRRRVPEVPYHRAYGSDGCTLRGAYLPRLVAELRAKNPGIAFTRANHLQIMRLAYRMMSDHGMRSHDIDRVIKRVAIAVFFVTEDDELLEREIEVLRQANRLRVNTV
jgi:hypothetical protein